MGDVVFRKVSKYFDTVCAVDEIDLEVKEGEFLALVGPSGCGKTTTLRMLAGLEFPNRGDIFVSGRRMNDIPAKDRNMAMVFQSYALYPHMTVYENMAFGLQVRKLPKAEIEHRVKDAAALMGIEDFLNRKPRQLSGGQRQRVAVCRAIVRDPVLFLFDEPLSNLDAKLRVQARGEIRKLQRRLRTTSIYVTHDQTEAMTMGDRVVVMNEGKIHQIGPPVELYNKPVDRFVAGFLGSPAMNFIKGTAARYNDELMLNLGGVQFPVLEYCKEGNDYILGFRPEHIRLTGDDENLVSVGGTVELIEPLGSDSIVMVDIGNTVVTIREDGQFNATIGETIKVRFDMKRSHLFDAGTGMRIEA